MPFCPKCKTEYRDGFTICADCKIPLVSSLEKADLSDISESSYSIDEEVFPDSALSEAVTVSEKDFSNLKLVSDEDEEEETLDLSHDDGPTEEEAEKIKAEAVRRIAYKPSKEYVSKDEKASELLSSGFMLTILGVLGCTFIALLMFGVFPFKVRGLVSYIIDGILCLFFASFIYFGINSFFRYSKVKKEASVESEENKEFEEWFRNKFTKEFVDSDLAITEDEQNNYFLRNAKIRYFIAQEYPDMDEDYLDSFIDKVYEEIFE